MLIFSYFFFMKEEHIDFKETQPTFSNNNCRIPGL